MAEQSLDERAGIAQYFGRLAKTYGAGAYYGKRRAAVIASLRDEIHGAVRMLDLGCGNGANLFELRDALGCELIVGADLSRQMLAEADRRQRAGIARVPLLCADAMALPFRTGAWDVIFCSHVLQMVPDVGGCIRGIGNALKPDGLLVVAGGGDGMGGQLLANLTDQQRDILRAGHRVGRRAGVRVREQIREACEAAGFTAELKRFPYTVTGAELAEWYRIRWIPVMEESIRTAVEQVLEQVSTERGTEQFEAAETLLLARKAKT